MGFKQSPDKRDVPGEKGAWMGFVALTRNELREARDRQQDRAMQMKIGSDMAAAMSNVPPSRDERPIAFADCDEETLLSGLAEWGGGEYEGKPCDVAHKAELIAGTAEWAARQVFEMSRITVGEASRSKPSGKDGAAPAKSSEPSSSPSPTPLSTSQQK